MFQSFIERINLRVTSITVPAQLWLRLRCQVKGTPRPPESSTSPGFHVNAAAVPAAPASLSVGDQQTLMRINGRGLSEEARPSPEAGPAAGTEPGVIASRGQVD